ncbi:Small RNA degrading nuclease [Seminavis robusta]|uniref:Small RNA degrading nuclease n=1 Tax=Seminavis robusta TaxID=568900 RepID=A0A9N8EL88_9STRA|nr:Small RNA degrading nuclease [Seminavis robusta]|eukprot:Sro1151_g246730.1 Small RNA degrading nuclease (580) ;mRNA; r:9009-10748
MATTATEGKNKKYKLFASAAGDGSKKPCAFFNTPAGCRMGDNCKFLHTAAAEIPATPTTSNSVVSSEESEGEIETEKPQQPTQQQKRKRTNEKNSNVFASPSGGEKKIKYTDLMKDITSEKKDTPPAAAKTPAVSPKQKKKTEVKKQQQPQNNKKQSSGTSFRDLNLPIASFMLPSGESKKEEEPTKEEKVKESPPPPAPKPQPTHVLPTSSEAGRKWKDIVEETQANPSFDEIFSMTKYKENPLPGDVWIKAKPFGKWCANNPQAIAIDCEMCETKDPVSGRKNFNALCRISVVNADDPDDVLLNTLVKPDWPVSDYRTWVNGIEKQHLDPVQFTLRHAQAFMVALCSEETVIMGHAVHNDLAAMRMEHECCADSALLFKAKDSPTATVSLKDLAATILKKEMPDTHDSVNDARTALLCLDFYREKDGDVEEIVRTPSNKRRNSKRADGVATTGAGTPSGGIPEGRTHHQLFVHRIPKSCKGEHIIKMFLEHTAVAPDQVNDIDFSSGSKGKTIISFKSPRHAFLAFDTLKGTAEPEKSGRLQKKVFLRDGDYVRIRKMAFEKNHVFPKSPSTNNESS